MLGTVRSPRRRQYVRAASGWVLLTITAGGSVSDFAGLLGWDFVPHGPLIFAGVALVSAVFVVVARPELRPFLRAAHAGDVDVSDTLYVDNLKTPADVRELARLAHEAFGDQAMPAEQIASLHGASGESIFVLRDRTSPHIAGYLALFTPTAHTSQLMLAGDEQVDIETWTAADFVTGSEQFSETCFYFDSFVVLEPVRNQRRLKSRLLQAYAGRTLLRRLHEARNEGPLTLLGYSEPIRPEVEPGAHLMMRRLGMSPVAGRFAHGMQLYSGQVSIEQLEHAVRGIETEIFVLRALEDGR